MNLSVINDQFSMKWYLKCFRQYSDFKGRARRSEYWMFTLFNFLALITALVLDNILGTSFSFGYGWIYFIYVIMAFLPGLAVAVRRLHDTNNSGTFLLIALVPIIGSIWLLVLLAKDGTKGSNKYGDDPKVEIQL